MKTSLKIDFASFQTFSPQHQVTQVVENSEFRLEVKGQDRIQTEIEKFIALPFPFSSKLKIWPFHVEVMPFFYGIEIYIKGDKSTELLSCS